MIKICGIGDLQSARLAIDAGATALGFVFAQSARRIEPSAAAAICHWMPDFAQRIGVFRGISLDDIGAIVAQVPLTALQVHLQPGLQLPLALHGLEVIPAGSLAEVETLPHGRVLVDSPTGAGSGQSWDYAQARALCGRRTVILAGGLRVANVASAVSAARPAGVDVSSGVEIDHGVKDPGMILAFCAAAAQAMNEVRQ